MSTVAFVVSLLIHVPPLEGTICIVLPIHTAVGAETIGNALTVTVALLVEVHPLLLVKVYVMTEVPFAIPETKPLEFIAATLGVALVHVPPLVVLFRVVVKPIHTANVPVIGFNSISKSEGGIS